LTISLTKNELRSLLEKQWTIVSFEDLGRMSQQSHYVYELFSKIKKDPYDVNEKIVFYSYKKPTYDLLNHIQKAASLFDISNNFVLICSPGAIQNDLESVRKMSSVDKHTFFFDDYQISDAESNHADGYHVPDTICPLPWTAIEIGASGNMRPCCYYGDNIKDKNQQTFNINSHTIDDYYFSDHMNGLRQQLQSGIHASGCKKCWVAQSDKIQSVRLFALYNQGKKFLSQSATEVSLERIISLDMDLGNLCNLKCRICNYQRSSQVAKEEIELATITEKPKVITEIKTWNQLSRWIDNKDCWDKLFPITDKLEYLEFEGGEPFFHDYHSVLLTKIIEKARAGQIRLRYSTNGTIFPEKLLPLWEKFREINLCLSIDDIGERFNYQRTLGNWSEVKNNLYKMSKLNQKNITFTVFPTVSIMNALYLPELMTELEPYNWHIIFNKVFTDPEYLSLTKMTKEAQDLVLSKWENFLQSHPRYLSLFNPLLDIIKSSPPASNDLFLQEMYKLDQHRGHNFAEAHPEMALAMGYINS
jgi:hypothetical protein